MLTYTLEKGSGKSLYAALYELIREDIRAGRLAAGTRLPSRRTLAANLGVSTVTVESAYAQLIAEGYAESKERSGVFVCAIGTAPLPSERSELLLAAVREEKPLLDLSGGGGEDVPFPFSVWARTMRTVISERGAALLHPVDFRGATELREAIAEHLYHVRGLRVSAEQIVVGAGNEYLYGLMVQPLRCGGPRVPQDYGHLSGKRCFRRAHPARRRGDERPRVGEQRGADRAHFARAPFPDRYRHACPPPRGAADVGVCAGGAVYS